MKGDGAWTLVVALEVAKPPVKRILAPQATSPPSTGARQPGFLRVRIVRAVGRPSGCLLAEACLVSASWISQRRQLTCHTSWSPMSAVLVACLFHFPGAAWLKPEFKSCSDTSWSSRTSYSTCPCPPAPQNLEIIQCAPPGARL